MDSRNNIIQIALFASTLSTVKGDSKGEEFSTVVFRPPKQYFISHGAPVLEKENPITQNLGIRKDAFFVSSLPTVKGDSEGEEFETLVISPTKPSYELNKKAAVLEKENPIPQNLGIRKEVALSPKDEHHHSVRKHTTCKVPSDSTVKYLNAQMTCIWSTKSVQCTQTCIFGHTFTEGMEREMKCKHNQNRWTPVPKFQACKPFIDCSMTLLPGGRLKCYTHFMDKGPNCDISCDRYEDKDAVPPANYQCDIEGKWSPKLPFCATLGSEWNLVPPPIGSKKITMF